MGKEYNLGKEIFNEEYTKGKKQSNIAEILCNPVSDPKGWTIDINNTTNIDSPFDDSLVTNRILQQAKIII